MKQHEVDRLRDRFRDYELVKERYDHVVGAAAARVDTPKVSIDWRGKSTIIPVPFDSLIRMLKVQLDAAAEAVRNHGGTLDVYPKPDPRPALMAYGGNGGSGGAAGNGGPGSAGVEWKADGRD